MRFFLFNNNLSTTREVGKSKAPPIGVGGAFFDVEEII
jgi:hypothetical protein